MVAHTCLLVLFSYDSSGAHLRINKFSHIHHAHPYNNWGSSHEERTVEDLRMGILVAVNSEWT